MIKTIDSLPDKYNIEPNFVWDKKTQWTSLKELAIISKLITALKPKTALEIGTFLGTTTYTIAKNMPAGGKVYTIDLPRNTQEYSRGHETGIVFGKEKEQLNIVQIFGNSKYFNFKKDLCPMDFVFIDGAHDFASAIIDSYQALLCATERACICWHDVYSMWEGVTNAVDIISKRGDGHVYHIRGTLLSYMILGE